MSYKHLFARNLQDNISSMVRVDYAGEMAAIKIYKAQGAVFPNDNHIPEMLDCEIIHFEYFKELARTLGIKPTIFLPLWQKISHTMGYLSARVSYSDAMLLTQAVEEVIEKHYAEQIRELQDIIDHAKQTDSYAQENKTILQNLLAQIKTFMEDEINHKNTGKANSQMKATRYTLAKWATKLAVILSKKY